MKKPNVIFLCTGNSARSQMAEAFLKKYANEHFEVYSAGFEPQGINPFTLKVMEELDYNLKNQYSKELKEFLGKVHFGIVITVCEKAEKTCPIIPGVSTRLFWSFEDPEAFEGTEQERINKFRQVRDQIHEQIQLWLRERGISS
ncbi:MAG: arsenate reductase ArsC [Candidatus Hodarchaeota archaeon]